jgi:hypothetical protein
MNIIVSKLPAFKEAYSRAIKEKSSRFIIENREALTSYAKCLIEYANTSGWG